MHKQELKTDSSITPRTVRQREKDVRSKYIALVENKERLTKSLKNKEEQITEESGWRKEDSLLKRQMEDKRQLMELYK